MNPETKATIDDLLDQNIPVYMEGVPGIGKTEETNQMFQARGWHLETLIASGLEPSDLGGLPSRTDSGVVCTPPAWAVRLMQEGDKPSGLFIDELTCCHPALQAPMLRLIQERRMNDWSLPRNCRIVAAMNPPDLAAGGWDLSAPAANRGGHVFVSPDLDSWIAWGINQPDPHGALAAEAAFLKSRPALFCSVPKEATQQAAAWPSPRTWFMASQVRTDGARVALVGSAAYAEFLQWKRAADLPSPEDVLSGKASIPERSDARFAVLVSIASLAARDYKTWGKAAWGIIIKVAEHALDEALVPARALATSAPTVPAELGKLAPALAKITR